MNQPASSSCENGSRRAIRRLIPPWMRNYGRALFADDLLAAMVVTIMLIPQSLAYAMLAGLSPQTGLYASILPLAVYALCGSSRTLSVGPVAVISLMTASAIGKVAATGSADYVTAAIALALLSGLMMLALGLLRFGFVANFLSHPVISGFITGSGILIALGQVRHLLGVDASGDTLPQLITSMAADLGSLNPLTSATGVAVMLFLFWARKGLAPALRGLGCPTAAAAMLGKAGPILVILATVAASRWWQFAEHGVSLVGAVPPGLPSLSLPSFDTGLWLDLAAPALLISVIGFVESVSVGRTLAAKRRQRVDANRELVALGAANVASAFSGAFPVTGGFSRSVVNFDAGAQTQASSLLAAAGIASAALLLTPLLHHLPKATLAATVIVAVSSLIDLRLLRTAWRYSRADFAALAITIAMTLLAGVELGVLCGVLTAIGLHLHATMRPHIAIVGNVPGTEHYRNVERHRVITFDTLVSIRVDESLYFANAAWLETVIYGLVAERPRLRHVILQCTAVNAIDLSALETLEAIDQRLREQGITLNLSEVKGPVMDALSHTTFLSCFSGKVFLSQHQAVRALMPREDDHYII